MFCVLLILTDCQEGFLRQKIALMTMLRIRFSLINPDVKWKKRKNDTGMPIRFESRSSSDPWR